MGTVPRIGIFDSGIGGLNVAAAIRQALPRERLLYFGDNAHVPYGERTSEEILAFSTAITGALLDQGCSCVVIACNTASSAALGPLRELFPEVPFIGMEPAVKPAVEHTRTGVVGVLATRATVEGRAMADVVERFSHGVEVIRQACPGLAQRIDAGDFDGPETERLLRDWIAPMLERNIDALVLGCTHYPLVRPLIEKIAGPDVRVIEPSEAIARRVEKVLEQHQFSAPLDATGILECYTSGDPESFRSVLERLGMEDAPVKQGVWEEDGTLRLP
ncbi:MAG: glutamate racemase [Flavobacteriales bacterium]|jgi:glutamate racemase|nr:glutamate racemase [Flavobacteriales bacterium]MBK6893248.1 glutamate racemase [Flavobacteriales bacterium]MBK7249021.1 glutamate racemase [Flavobacteriales bacterium]MBK9058737.1 glutamate racemase [Flavobacteriales bacterium]MBK9599942.1 glutamate racemase [Flavobacteriales bacterium]